MQDTTSANLADGLQSLTLGDPEHLLFNPTGDKAWLKEKFDDIPRYLFRITTPDSDATTDRHWVKSKAARYRRTNSTKDIFESYPNSALDPSSTVAKMLNKHLRWSGRHPDADNFVSWTSSLLFALQYMFYRHMKDGSDLAKIYLCIIDTLSFPKGIFLRDMDLIRAYSAYDEDLKSFEDLRRRKHGYLTGFYYFGEYLSQGALKIEGQCQLVSSQAIVDNGLYSLRSDIPMEGFANAIVQLREVFYQTTDEPQPFKKEELKAAIDIAKLFEPRWSLPMLANLLGLLPRKANMQMILQAFKANLFKGSIALCPLLLGKLTGKVEWGENCLTSKTKIFAYETLPEVQQFKKIMQNFHHVTCIVKMRCQSSNDLIVTFWIKR
ncbi:MAG: hypothetical protein Q9225_003619 [Loekoesia sp. 1 TL-2023]